MVTIDFLTILVFGIFLVGGGRGVVVEVLSVCFVCLFNLVLFRFWRGEGYLMGRGAVYSVVNTD